MTQEEVDEELRQAVFEYRRRDAHLRDRIGVLRFWGATWRQIGSVLGVTPQGAMQRWGIPVVREHVDRHGCNGNDGGDERQ